MPQFEHEPQAELTYGNTTLRLPYTLVHHLAFSVGVSSATPHFDALVEAVGKLKELRAEMMDAERA